MDGPTEVIPTAEPPPPVFVDPSGRRRQWLQRVAYAAGAIGLAYTAMVGASFAGGPIRPETILPFVDATRAPVQPAPARSTPVTEPTVGPGPAPTPARAGATGGSGTSPSPAPSTSAGSTTPASPRPSPTSAGPPTDRPSTEAPTPTPPAPTPPAPTVEVPPEVPEVPAPDEDLP